MIPISTALIWNRGIKKGLRRKGVTTQEKVKWSMEADYLQACNCDYGCPCEFEAPPTQGYCEGIGAWQINRGSYGNVPLNGLSFGFALRSKGPIHEGDLTLAVFVDERASQQQREALLKIASGVEGGLPFEIIASLVGNLLEPQFVPIELGLTQLRVILYRNPMVLSLGNRIQLRNSYECLLAAFGSRDGLITHPCS